MSMRRASCVSLMTFTLFVFVLAGPAWAAGLNLGDAVGAVKDAVGAASKAAQPATVPAGAFELFRKVDQCLDKVARMLSDESANISKDDRSKEAGGRLAEAREAFKTAEQRHGAKMGADHPELVSRRQRIAEMEAKVEAFQKEMSAAIQQDKEALATAAQNAEAQEAARKEKEAAAMRQREEAAQQAQQAQAAPSETAGSGKIVFSKTRIDPANPQNLINKFQAGDRIYGLIRPGKSWREIYKAGDKTELGIMVGMQIGESDTFQYITLKKDKYIDSNFLAIEIAPDPATMTSYKDPDIAFGEGKGNRKIGPIAFTYDLSKLAAGAHTVKFYVRNYGDFPATGEFKIEGTDYSCYADLHEKVKAASEAVATLPPAGMVNKSLEAEMRGLLENAGWTNILRVVIIDKDWWLDGTTSRYLNVAAASKDESGQCYWCTTKFAQPKLINGSWGKLELTYTGHRRNIAEENVNK